MRDKLHARKLARPETYGGHGWRTRAASHSHARCSSCSTHRSLPMTRGGIVSSSGYDARGLWGCVDRQHRHGEARPSIVPNVKGTATGCRSSATNVARQGSHPARYAPSTVRKSSNAYIVSTCHSRPAVFSMAFECCDATMPAPPTSPWDRDCVSTWTCTHACKFSLCRQPEIPTDTAAQSRYCILPVQMYIQANPPRYAHNA